MANSESVADYVPLKHRGENKICVKYLVHRHRWAKIKRLNIVLSKRSQQSKELKKRVYRATRNDYATWHSNPGPTAYAQRILASEEMTFAISTTSVITADNTPSAKFRVSCVLCLSKHYGEKPKVMFVLTSNRRTKNPKIFGAPTPVSKDKTIKYRFIKAKSTKQGVEEASVSSDAQRLCDLTLEPWTYCIRAAYIG